MKRFLLVAAIIAAMIPTVAQENPTPSDSTVGVNATEKAVDKGDNGVRKSAKRTPAKMTVKAGPTAVVVELPSDTTVVSEEIIDETLNEASDEINNASDALDDALDELDEEFSHDRRGWMLEWFDNMTQGGMVAVTIVTAVLTFLFFLFPLIAIILIVWLIVRYRHKRNRERDELIRDLADKGQDVSSYFKQETPQNVVYRTESNRSQSSRKVKRPLSNKEMYDKGITNAIIGGVITVVCAIYDWPSLFILGGLILLGLGVSQIIRGRGQDEYAEEDKSDSAQEEKPEEPTPADNEEM